MTIGFSCECGKQFRVADDKAGTRAKCPGCGTVLRIPGAAAGSAVKAAAPARPKSDPDDGAEERRRPPRPAAKEEAITERASRKARPAAAPPDEEVDSGVEIDEDDDRPRRPKRSRKLPDDEDVAEAEIDEDDDDQPRRRSLRSRKKKTGKVLLIVTVSILSVLVVSGSGVAVWWFLRSGHDEDYLPNNTNTVVSINIDAIEASGVYQRLKSELKMLQKEPLGMAGANGQMVGLRDGELSRVLVATSVTDGELAICTLKKPLTAEEIAGRTPGVTYTKIAAGSHTVYNGPTGTAFAVPRKGIVLVGNVGPLRGVLERQESKMTPAMRTGLKHLSPASPLSMVITPDPGLGKIQMGGLPMDALGDASALDMVVLNVELGADIKIAATGFCKTPQAAENSRAKAQQGLAQAKNTLPPQMQEFKQLLDGVQVTSSGSTVSIRGSIAVDPIIRALKPFDDMMSGPFGGNPPPMPGRSR